MSEYWVSQGRKFCDYCKCWIADNKASIGFHESGKRHQKAVQDKLKDIRRKGISDAKRSRQEDVWLRQMEENAMKDYRSKDLDTNADITAKIFNEKRMEREENRVAAEEEAAAQAEATAHSLLSGGGASSSGGSEIGPEAPGPHFRSVEAPRSGTKWHNPPPPKKWFEAKSDEGHTYYWHIETNDSRWEPPPEGFLSIEDQEKINKKHEKREQKKMAKIMESQVIHGTHDFGFVEGPEGKPDPYGTGWQKVQPPKKPAEVDWETPEQKAPIQANVTLHDDRPAKKFAEKTTPSLGGASKGPAIKFRKRKINQDVQIRKREEDE